MLNFFKKSENPKDAKDNLEKRRAEPSAPTTQELLFRLKVLEARVYNIEDCIMKLCEGFRLHVERLDHQDHVLNENMHRIASMAIRPPKDLLGGDREVN